MRRRAFALLILIAGICPFAAAALRCDVSVPAPAYLRPNGLTELLADIVLTCDGDAPSGGIASDINLFFNTQTYGFGSTGPPVILSGEGKNGWKMGDNVFAAQTLTGNQIHWSQVKLMPVRYRFTNLRIGADMLAGGGMARPNVILAAVEIKGVEVTHSVPMVGVITPPSGTDILGCDGARIANNAFVQTHAVNAGLLDSSGLGEQMHFLLHYTEAFESAFKPIAATQSASVSSFAESPSEGLMRAGIPGLRNPDFGTRFVANFSNVPDGVSIFVTTEPTLAGMKRSDSIDARLVGFDDRGAGRAVQIDATGVARCSGVGLGVVQVPLQQGHGAAVWEVTASDPTALEEISFGVAIAFRPEAAGLPRPGVATVNLSIGPMSTVTGNSPTAPMPRFADTSMARNLFTIVMPVTRLVFPFVANVAGYDTHLSVTNTAPSGTGPCLLTFAADTAGDPALPPASMNPIAAGATQAIDVSSVAPGFRGCVLAECRFSSAAGQYRVSPFSAGPEILSGPALDPGNISKQTLDDLSAKTQGLTAKCPYLMPGAVTQH